MTDFFKKHKKFCTVVGIIIAVIVFAGYLFALFLPGYWYGDTFLYEKGYPYSMVQFFSGRDIKNDADYELTIAKDGKTTYMVFTVNEAERSYEITSDDSINHHPKVTIAENDEVIFIGTAKSGFLFDENDELFEPPITVTYDAYEPTEEELFPSYTWLYGVSQNVKTEIRGEPIWLISIIIVIAVCVFDMKFPDFFWNLEHGLEVKGGEPSDLYRFIQKAAWVSAPIVVVIFMILTFTTHI
ncbi:MAG: hypothetical protein IJ306_10490 [Oscillospiraceae bacterium]|nr:hypothetical protein [Oscillospiraceae bacterium]